MNDREKELKEIVLRDLEPVLRQRLGDKVIVESFTSDSLLPPGENYGSTVLSVHVDYKDGQTGRKEELNLIAKMLPPTEFQRRIFNSSRTFIKEIFMYETVMPAYNKLEMECGLRKNEMFDILPKFYGSRLSMRSDLEFDDNAVFLMDNLKVKGYYTGNRSIGYDLEHSGMAIKSLARFHALGMAMKQKKPGIFEMFKMHARSLQIDGDAVALLRSTLEKIKEDPEINIYYDRCEKILNPATIRDLWADTPRDPWVSIIHSDFWVNNVLFHRGESGKIDDVKFVDFQMYLYSSPLRDLLFYLFSSVQLDVTDDEIEGLMDLYYETLVHTLKNMRCDTSAFTKEGYREKISTEAYREFTHLCVMVKIMTMNIKESDYSVEKMQTVMANYGGSSTFVDRIRRIVTYFCKHDWI